MSHETSGALRSPNADRPSKISTINGGLILIASLLGVAAGILGVIAANTERVNNDLSETIAELEDDKTRLTREKAELQRGLDAALDQTIDPPLTTTPDAESLVYLSTAEAINSPFVEPKPIKINGREYPQSLYFTTPLSEPFFADYDLGRDFRTLTGVLGVVDEAQPDEKCHWRIIADGKEIFTAETSLGQPATIPPMNLETVLRLRIEVLDGGGLNGLPYPCGVGDPAVQ